MDLKIPHELHVMKYKEAMHTPDKDKWTIAVKEELHKFKEHDVFEPVKLTDVPIGAKMLTTTWAMKKKSNGTYRARLNMPLVCSQHPIADLLSAPDFT